MDPSLSTNQGGEKVQELEQKLVEMRQQAQPQEPVSTAAPQQMPPTYPTTPVVEPTSSPPAPPKNPSTSLPVLIILFLLVALATIGYYLASLGIISVPGVTPTPIQPSTSPVPIQTSSPVPTMVWQTYTNTGRYYTIQYPSDWVLDKSKAETPLDSVNGAQLIISQGNYKISILWPAAFGPGICIFDDQSREGASEIASFCEGDYVEIKSDDGKSVYRRLAKPSISGNQATWSVYSRDKSGYFVTVPPISFTAPFDYQSDTIGIMDKIIATYTSTN